MEMDFSQFSPTAREVIKQAQREAVTLRHSEVAPEHILAALAGHQRARSYAMLRDLAVPISKVQSDARKALGPGRLSPFQSAGDSTRTRRVLELARSEASTFGDSSIGTEHLLLGLIREGGIAKEILANYGVSLYGIHKLLRTLPFHDGDQLPAVDLKNFPVMRSETGRYVRSVPIRPSRVFLGVLGFTTLMGVLLYLNLPLAIIPGFLFVVGGWIISVCLHEFGHAFVAYIGGDTTVVDKGYLTLNPLKYTNRLLSIIIPLVILILGGIALPGGCVYVDRSVIRSRRLLSWLSAAGITAQVILILILIVPFHIINLLSPTSILSHVNFWGSYLFLIFLNIFSILINLLPIPGIDGYGIIEPYLPLRITVAAEKVRPYAFIILLIILMLPNPIGALIGLAAGGIASLLGVNMALSGVGQSLFRFR